MSNKFVLQINRVSYTVSEPPSRSRLKAAKATQFFFILLIFNKLYEQQKKSFRFQLFILCINDMCGVRNLYGGKEKIGSSKPYYKLINQFK